MARTTKQPQPGDRYSQGTVCKLTDDGVYLGLEAKPGQEAPRETTTFTFEGGRRAFLSDHQGPIRTSLLVK